MGAPVVAGRTFTEAEDSPVGGHVAVLSYGLWQRRFAGDPKIVGSIIQLDGQPWQVVGVIGRNFVTDTPAELWVPFQFDLTSREMVHNFNVAARLKPGVTIAVANAQLALAARRVFRRTYGNNSMPPNDSFGVPSLQESIVGDTRLPSWFCSEPSASCCSSPAPMWPTSCWREPHVRRREFATRAALGAGRGQIVRQLLAESLALSLTGGLLGLLLGFGGLRLLLSMSPSDIPRIGEHGTAIVLDLRVLLFTLGVSLLTGITFGLLPAISASRPNLSGALNENSSRSGIGFRHGKIRSLLVISEMALALVLVIGAALLIRTFLKLEQVDPGFTTHNVLTAAMSVSGSRFQQTAPVAQIVRDGRERLMALPGVLDAAASNCLPLQGGFGMTFDVLGRPRTDAPFTGLAGFYSISRSYFSAFEIPLTARPRLHGAGRCRCARSRHHQPGLRPEVLAQRRSAARPDADRRRCRPRVCRAAPCHRWCRRRHP